MVDDDGDADGAWVPQPLPADDELAREPDPDELELVFADAAPTPPTALTTGAPAADAPAALTADGPAALTADAPGAVDLPDAPGPADVADAPVAPVVPVATDAALEAAVLPEILLRPDAVAPTGRHSWTRLFIGVVVLAFCIFAPLQVLAGGILLWAIAYAVGATLTIVGGLAIGKAFATRGSAPLGPFVALVSGTVVIVVCAVVAVVGSQGRTT